MEPIDKFNYCENIKISEFNQIQEFCYFIVIDLEDMIIKSVSENAQKIHLCENSTLLGKKISDIMEEKSINILNSVVENLINNENYFCLELDFKYFIKKTH